MFRVDAKVKNGTVDESHLARSTTVEGVSVKGEGAQPGAGGGTDPKAESGIIMKKKELKKKRK